jgi:signal transduction histidine kinase
MSEQEKNISGGTDGNPQTFQIVFDGQMRILAVNPIDSAEPQGRIRDWLGKPVPEIFPVLDADRLAEMLGRLRQGPSKSIWAEFQGGLHPLATGAKPGQSQERHLFLLGELEQERGAAYCLSVFHSGALASVIQETATREAQASQRMMQSEKLAAIGQLAAGVAHEINNPLGFVFSNLKTLGEYVRDLIRIVDEVDTANDLDVVRELKQRLDYEYIRSDVGSLLLESEDGIDRVKTIIGALKDFSHIGEEEFKFTDLHRGLETTLNVVNNELKYKAKVVKEFGDVPLVECIASQINQVALNLLVNAAHAIEQFGQITIRTGHDDGWAWFEVRDTGKGIEPAVLSRIFEPFFTTKPVGKGTGLGLSLSYNIVQKHNGRIEVDSKLGEGTCFRVWLPVSQPVAAADSEARP